MANAIGPRYLAINMETNEISQLVLGGEPEEWVPFVEDMILQEENYVPGAVLYGNITDDAIYYIFNADFEKSIGVTNNWGDLCDLTPEQEQQARDRLAFLAGNNKGACKQ